MTVTKAEPPQIAAHSRPKGGRRPQPAKGRRGTENKAPPAGQSGRGTKEGRREVAEGKTTGGRARTGKNATARARGRRLTEQSGAEAAGAKGSPRRAARGVGNVRNTRLKWAASEKTPATGGKKAFDMCRCTRVWARVEVSARRSFPSCRNRGHSTSAGE